MKVLRPDEVEATPILGSRWIPIRSTLGIESFGINAYEAVAAGDPLLNEHDETEALAGRQRHQELYVVLSGRATFTINGKELEAAPGTLVFVEDPASRRGAVAAAPGTRLLAIGAPVGEPYQPDPWEARFLEARAS